MRPDRRWDQCVIHREGDVGAFINEYLAREDRKVLLVVGSGFDPRSCAVATRLAGTRGKVQALLVSEERRNSSGEQSRRAQANRRRLLEAFVDRRLVGIEMFGPDNAVVGGRKVTNALHEQDLTAVTDVVVDVSALSVGLAFPVVRYFVEYADGGSETLNLHVFVVHDPDLDANIRSVAGDSPMYVHGFKGSSTLSGMADAATLWLPQLAAGRNAALGRLYDFVEPHDTCPILPFPAVNPRVGDELAEMYLTELESTWAVDTRNIIYADEGDPLDLYRTILRLDDLRRPVFQRTGGSMLVLSPLGSKLMALGALMAALERNLPVAYLESIGYEMDSMVPEEVNEPSLIHLWLEGDVYPRPRPRLQTQAVLTP